MNSTDVNKVVIPLGGRPMIEWTVERLHAAGIQEITVVVGFARDSVEEVLGDAVAYASQTEQLGTGHAAVVGLPALSPAVHKVVVVYGDHSAFYTPNFYEHLLQTHDNEGNAVTMVVLEKDDPQSLAWGRVVRASDGSVAEIVEDRECTPEQKLIKELNAGCYVFDRAMLEQSLPQLPRQTNGEYYLTDVISWCVARGLRVGAVTASDELVGIGVNTPEQHADAEALFSRLLRQ